MPKKQFENMKSKKYSLECKIKELQKDLETRIKESTLVENISGLFTPEQKKCIMNNKKKLRWTYRHFKDKYHYPIPVL